MLIRLGTETELLEGLKIRTLGLIRACPEIAVVKKFVECHDILDLTLSIHQRFPPKDLRRPPECDESALLRLKTVTQELNVMHSRWLPAPEFNPQYVSMVRKLLWLYRLPRDQFR